MADAGELIRDAQYAFHNITHGESRGNRKNTSRAKTLARKIIRKFPNSVEAGQAQQILDRLEPDSVTYATQKVLEHRFDQKDRHEQVEPHHRPLDGSRSPDGDARAGDRDWKKLLLRLAQINGNSRNFILVALFLLITLLPFAALAILAIILFLTGPFKQFHPRGTQENLDKLYTQLDAWATRET
jgi:hypothetical protein